MQKEEPLRVGSFSRFPDFCGTFFSSSLSSSLEFVGRFLSLVSLSDEHRISHPIVFLARCALLGFQTREREKERRNKSSVAIINTNNNNNKV